MILSDKEGEQGDAKNVLVLKRFVCYHYYIFSIDLFILLSFYLFIRDPTEKDLQEHGLSIANSVQQNKDTFVKGLANFQTKV